MNSIRQISQRNLAMDMLACVEVAYVHQVNTDMYSISEL
jgi:hypothetical protein